MGYRAKEKLKDVAQLQNTELDYEEFLKTDRATRIIKFHFKGEQLSHLYE